MQSFESHRFRAVACKRASDAGGSDLANQSENDRKVSTSFRACSGTKIPVYRKVCVCYQQLSAEAV